MTRTTRLGLGLVAGLALVVSGAWAQPTAADVKAPGADTQRLVTQQIGIDQKLGAMLPMDAPFTDASDESRPLREFFRGRPVLIMPIFYDCKGTCTLVFDAVMKTLIAMKKDTVGDTFDVITFSIDPSETPAQAADRRKECLDIYTMPNPRDGMKNLAKDRELAEAKRRQNAEAGWHFLVGSERSVKALTEALGFRYTINPTTGQINHPAGIMIASPEGKISQYFYGVEYAAPMVMNAIERAATNQVGNVAEVKLFGCLAYDPVTGTYKVVIEQTIKVLAGLTFLVVVLSITLMSLRHRTVDPDRLPPTPPSSPA